MNEPLRNTENCARAIFSPLMIDEKGNISRSAFALRHNEDYISVCQMSVASWADDMKAIPENEQRRFYGYAVLNVRQTRALSFSHVGKLVSFDVVDKHTERNKSHAGIIVLLDGQQIKGDKRLTVKPVPADIAIDAFVLRFQARLAALAQRNYIVKDNL